MNARPLIHCVTNDVTAGRVADAVAAAGGRPIMAVAEDEAADVARGADAVVLNCGTPSAERFRVLEIAGSAAAAARRPIVLDPVHCGASPWRTARQRELAARVRPSVVRGSVREVATLAGVDAAGDIPAGHAAEEDVARRAAVALRSVACAGRTISDGARTARRAVVAPVLADVIGAGDVLDALIALACAGGGDTFAATESALARFDASAVRAGARPGSFWPTFLDALAEAGR